MTLYNSLFRSHMEFSILSYGNVKNTKLKKIINIQKKCIRNVAGKGHRAHTDPLFSALNVLKFEDLFRYNCFCFIHKYFLNRLPDSFKDKYLPFFSPNRTNSLQISKAKNDYLKQFPAFFLPIFWNKNSLENKLLESHTTFKKAIYEEFISNYPPAFKCKSKTCPDCKK